MKQPKIKIFGGVYDVIEIGFDRKTGLIKKIMYRTDGDYEEVVFRGDEVFAGSLSETVKIHEPTRDPYYGFAYAPDLESLVMMSN